MKNSFNQKEKHTFTWEFTRFKIHDLQGGEIIIWEDKTSPKGLYTSKLELKKRSFVQVQNKIPVIH